MDGYIDRKIISVPYGGGGRGEEDDIQILPPPPQKKQLYFNELSLFSSPIFGQAIEKDN